MYNDYNTHIYRSRGWIFQLLFPTSSTHLCIFWEYWWMTQLTSFNTLFFIPYLAQAPFLIFIRLFLSLNKMQSTSTQSYILKSRVSEIFPVWLDSWFWLYIVRLSYMKTEDRHSNSILSGWIFQLHINYLIEIGNRIRTSLFGFRTYEQMFSISKC